MKAPRPNDVAEVRSFVGLTSYYHKFLPNLSTAVHPLNRLLASRLFGEYALEKNRRWKWTKQCDEAFLKVKEMTTLEHVVTHYDPNLPLRLACDASPVGIGAVLSHVMFQGTHKNRPKVYTY